ncbi:hypothetical protein [Lacticaseibacillus porcinae]|uniref:hypothetical protein n=1 Tax=Lacticaseibacillus porcinae TaxID=1123687 RepID=UPI000F790F71|nr:hypothetical protein [Lacticaseibacillus porcinae]
MQVIFKVRETPFLTVTLNADQSQIVSIDASDQQMAELAFPKVFHQPAVGQLLLLLKAYADLTGNLGIRDVITQTGGAISWIPFKPNLTVVFEEDSNENFDCR